MAYVDGINDHGDLVGAYQLVTDGPSNGFLYSGDISPRSTPPGSPTRASSVSTTGAPWWGRCITPANLRRKGSSSLRRNLHSLFVGRWSRSTLRGDMEGALRRPHRLRTEPM